MGFWLLPLDQQKSMDVYNVILLHSPFSRTLMIFLIDEAYRFDIQKNSKWVFQRNHSTNCLFILVFQHELWKSNWLQWQVLWWAIWISVYDQKKHLDLVMSRYPRNYQSRSLQDSCCQKRNGDLLGSKWVWGGSIMLHTSTVYCLQLTYLDQNLIFSCFGGR